MIMSTPRFARQPLLAAATAASAVALCLAGCTSSSPDASTTTQAPPAASSTTEAEPVVDVGDGGDYQPTLDPAKVSPVIDNPWYPLLPGTTWIYEGTSDGVAERIVVEVLDQRRTVMGIEATVVRDTVEADGQVVEDTYDWYAQDSEGNVWYLGEEVKDYEDGKLVSTKGSWEAGVDGALPGIVMPAQPVTGDAYRQEFLPGEAEDMFEILATDDRDDAGGTIYGPVVTTEDWNPLDPEMVEHKHYAEGIGMTSEDTVHGGEGRVELISVTMGSAG